MCLGTFVFVGSCHVVSIFIHCNSNIILITLVTKLWNLIFLWKIIHIEPLTNTINTILWCIWVYLGIFGCIWVYLGVFGYIWVYLGKRSRPKENTGKENRMLNWVIWTGYGLETNVIVGMSSDQFYEWKRTLEWRKYFWTGKCNVYILTMKINRCGW